MAKLLHVTHLEPRYNSSAQLLLAKCGTYDGKRRCKLRYFVEILSDRAYAYLPSQEVVIQSFHWFSVEDNFVMRILLILGNFVEIRRYV